MRFLLATVCACALAAALAASSAFGFANFFDYVGSVDGNPSASVGFALARPAAGGPKRVHKFTVTQVPYTCRDAPPGATEGWQFKPRMRVEKRKFDGKGDWVGLPLDPVGSVSGKLRRNGKATGQFKLRGELAGPGTHCRTGKLDWTAGRNVIPFR